MPRLAYRSRRITIRIPGGNNVTHYEKKKPKLAHCALCGRPLQGIPKLRVPDLRRLSKTKKRPGRIYGGYICHECLAELLRRKIRKGTEILS
ncbi:MAG: 50S ribosomal protein L34e [Desulfurococcales archaeon]|nr:50S ribosomal protein L34e [Desulfurococcales archaeon]